LQIKKLLKNKDLNAASKLQIYQTIIRPIVTYGCETWTMTVTEQNRLLVFERRVLRKIYGPTQDKTGIASTELPLRLHLGLELVGPLCAAI
jgi:hypothetical protein